MAYTYTGKGRRYLRKYTAASRSPVYAAAIDAQNIADTLCMVPWESVYQSSANFTCHNNEGLDGNVDNRDSFDAALFCADHSDGEHRAFANAACYRMTLPDDAVGVPLESVTVRAASDPYNAAGLRLAFLVSSTGEVPMDCATCRNGNAHVEGAVPRTSEIGEDGRTYWYAASGDVTITPSSPVALDKYLLVFVLLENYAASRDNWLEGSGYILNSIKITTSAEIPDWDDQGGETGANAYDVVRDGVLPAPVVAKPSGYRHEEVQVDGSPVVNPDGSFTPAPSSITPQQSVYGLQRLYRIMFAGDGVVQTAVAGDAQRGAMWRMRRTSKPLTGKLASKGNVNVWELDSSVLFVPVVMPDGFTPSSIRFGYDALGLPDGATYNVFIATG